MSLEQKTYGKSKDSGNELDAWLSQLRMEKHAKYINIYGYRILNAANDSTFFLR